MSSRHNKNALKRKGRQQARERTVTTLTGDSDTLFNSNHHHSVDDDQTMSNGPSHFLAPAFFPNFVNQSQASTYPAVPPPAAPAAAIIPGSNDLEKLENLKNIIKSSQHQLFTTEPKPEALAALFLGQITHSGQEKTSEEIASRPPRLQGKDMARKSVQSNHYQNQSGQASTSVDDSPYTTLKTANYPPDVKLAAEPEDEPMSLANATPLAARITHTDDAKHSSHYQSPGDTKPYADTKPYPDESISREFIPARRDSAVATPGNGSALPPPSGSTGDSRYYDPRDRDRERERESWDRDRRPIDSRYDRDDFRAAVPSDSRRYEPDLYPSRRYDDNRRRDDRDRPNPRPLDDRQRTDERDRYPSAQRMDDRYHTRPDDRDYDRRAMYPDDRRVETHMSADPRVSTRGGAPLSVSTAPLAVPGPGRSFVEDRNGRPIPTSPAQSEEKTRVPTLEERISSRVPTLQERLNQPPARGSTVPPSEPAANASNNASPATATTGRQQPTLEQRISQAPTSTGINGSDPPKTPASLDPDVRDPRERSASGSSAISPRTATPSGPLAPDERGRPLARESFPPSGAGLPPPPTRTEPRGRYPSRSASVARDIAHARSSSVAPSVRDSSPAPSVGGGSGRQDSYRREASRERTTSANVPPPGANSYRPDDRAYVDRDRERDRMDMNVRYPDRHTRYPPHDRDRARVPSGSGRTSPPHHYPPPSYEDRDRRAAPAATRDYPPYDYDRRRDWNGAEDDPYWKSRSTYPPPAPPERERYEREPGPPLPSSSTSRAPGWETREEHDSRRTAQLNIYPPARSADPTRERDSLPARPPTNGSKLEYPPPPPPPHDDRDRYERLRHTVNPHNHPQSAVALASFSSRVRQRSPSPVRRAPNAVVDDRPPLKRPREDYPPPPPPPVAPASTVVYTRPREPAAYPSGPARYSTDYDSHRAPPAPVSEYRRPEYPASYDRPRSPGRGAMAGGYSNNYRPDPRDDRRYMPPR
ncbi:hypothetical protein VNI00_009699 [Paramarasmius palmivorus]|uniref:Uncharacterized protein n=1 Tax=Paramarasmius palmivorus TaxID=297713 RepID=A0AAW0CQF9_9AGAR